MEYSIRFDGKEQIISVSVKGELNLSSLKGMAADVAKSVKENDCNRILNDLRNAKPTNRILDIYKMPESVDKIGVEKTIKRALLVEGDPNEYHFLETVFVNQGHRVKLFTDIEIARKWLRET